MIVGCLPCGTLSSGNAELSSKKLLPSVSKEYPKSSDCLPFIQSAKFKGQSGGISSDMRQFLRLRGIKDLHHWYKCSAENNEHQLKRHRGQWEGHILVLVHFFVEFSFTLAFFACEGVAT
ncbi:hypothetical protein EPI10_025005 [Gossypium australe]|uniref:Uncharacterized protein n=1 Tax=Gossypium australe TaxID=47621 RepID=A0A5B6W0J7_9ROSI|nr:hypothetical protein EPI10_025005 [Gossypium australe]